MAEPKGSWAGGGCFGGEAGAEVKVEFWDCTGAGDAEGGGVSSHSKSCIDSDWGGAGAGVEKGEATFLRMEGGTRLWGNVVGISFPASLP